MVAACGSSHGPCGYGFCVDDAAHDVSADDGSNGYFGYYPADAAYDVQAPDADTNANTNADANADANDDARGELRYARADDAARE